MPEYHLGEIEARFADLIWDRQPIPSGQLVALCQQQFQWKKSTTYTVLRRLCQRGLFENKDGQVRALVSREQYLTARSTDFVDSTFGGSLPRFLTAFTGGKRLSEEELTQLTALIERHRRGGE
ncbi:MAG: BlaI/MecI/CopY family transcriptional regulator [Clostridia bacterium]|nr:BlaI/MecI/CopY family transcriptional regulator [Clostridia bacterium]